MKSRKMDGQATAQQLGETKESVCMEKEDKESHWEEWRMSEVMRMKKRMKMYEIQRF